MNKVLQILPKKESNALKEVIKHFDEKKYKKALKSLDKIVTKFGKRDEYAMLENLMKVNLLKDTQKAEGQDLIKSSKSILMKKLKSGFNWQMLGLMHKKLKNYPEAGKTLLQAVKFEKDNRVLYRDGCNLLLQSRDLINHTDQLHPRHFLFVN